MIEIILFIISAIVVFFTIAGTPVMTYSFSKPVKRVRFKEPIMSHSMTNHNCRNYETKSGIE